MNIVGISVLGIVILLAIGMLLDVKKAKKQSAANDNPVNTPLQTANESEATRTGRFRVQEMLSKTAHRQKPAEDPAKSAEEDTSLPDPFSSDLEN